MFGNSSQDEDNYAHEEFRKTATAYPTLRQANAARQELWDPAGHLKDLDWRCNELAGEAGEVCNILKKLQRERLGLPGSRATVEQLAEELADVIICVDLVGMQIVTPFIEFLGPLGRYQLPPATLTRRGNTLMTAVGLVCHAPTVYRPIFSGLVDISIVIRSIAADECIGLGRAVEQKFNATSEKVGLPVRLEMTTGAMAVEPIPPYVYYRDGNFYATHGSHTGMGRDFYAKWRHRAPEFPTEPA